MTLITPQRSKLAPGIIGWSLPVGPYSGQGSGPGFGQGFGQDTGHRQAPPMLLIHGVGMRAEFWSNIESDLARSFALTVIDMPGHGKSPALQITDPELSDYTDCIAGVLRKINQPVVVVGHSMGALIAMDMAVRYKSNVSGIAVLNGVYRRSHTALQAIQARVTELSATQVTDPTATLERWFGNNPQGIEAQSATFCRDWLAQVNQKGYRAAYRAFATADAPPEEQLQQLGGRALFMTGALEPNSTPAMSQRMSQLVPNAVCHVVDEARHMMTMTHGPQVVNAINECFLPMQVTKAND